MPCIGPEIDGLEASDGVGRDEYPFSLFPDKGDLHSEIPPKRGRNESQSLPDWEIHMIQESSPEDSPWQDWRKIGFSDYLEKNRQVS